MLKTESIAAFVAIVESGSISEAARRLRLSKSVVSERLAELEKVLKVVLLHRTTRKLTLTEDGTAFLAHAQRITAEIVSALANVSERRGTLSGSLRISAPVTFSRMHLGPALYPFLLAHPELELTLDIDDRRVDAVSDGYDAVIRHGAIADNRLIALKLAPSQRILVASPDYLATHGTPKSLAELQEHRGLFYTNRGVRDWRFQTEEGPVLIRAKQAVGINNGDMLRDAAIAGLGIALLPTFITGPVMKAGLLTEIALEHKPEGEFIHLAHPLDRGPSAKLRAIVQHLRQTFGDPPYWDC